MWFQTNFQYAKSMWIVNACMIRFPALLHLRFVQPKGELLLVSQLCMDAAQQRQAEHSSLTLQQVQAEPEMSATVEMGIDLNSDLSHVPQWILAKVFNVIILSTSSKRFEDMSRWSVESAFPARSTLIQSAPMNLCATLSCNDLQWLHAAPKPVLCDSGTHTKSNLPHQKRNHLPGLSGGLFFFDTLQSQHTAHNDASNTGNIHCVATHSNLVWLRKTFHLQLRRARQPRLQRCGGQRVGGHQLISRKEATMFLSNKW